MLELVEGWQQRGHDDLDVALKQVNDANVHVVPGARSAGITVVDASGIITTLGATSEDARRLDDAQRATGEGPCLSAAWEQHTVHIEDFATERRWPRFCDTASDQTSVRSVLSFHLFTDKDTVAALNFHARSSGVFDQDSVEAGLLVAAHTMVAWKLVSRERQFRSALANRDAIGQAKGMLMERFGIDAFAAFELLKRLSQDTNTKLSVVAEKVVAADQPPVDRWPRSRRRPPLGGV
ncbi:GAF and ANTAR domain-containing protein [Mycobacterium yunnanensis]|uniref:GAF and ANTAR domain-containing protein n=1 Tax=Mycobacterium yunnanensis TaxID=368477 RepID=A0A9X2Z1Q1_9MYCO|nr:GAF and ANTAR domain-containing protein [Mycobacterium yunnanensis]